LRITANSSNEGLRLILQTVILAVDCSQLRPSPSQKELAGNLFSNSDSEKAEQVALFVRVVHSPSEQAEHSDFAHNALMEALN
jgi:hypothetical protein